MHGVGVAAAAGADDDDGSFFDLLGGQASGMCRAGDGYIVTTYCYNNCGGALGMCECVCFVSVAGVELHVKR